MTPPHTRAPLTQVPLSDAPRPRLDLHQQSWPGEYVESGGVRLYTRRTPGPPDPAEPAAVFVHGLGGSSANWTDLAAQLSGYTHGIAVDLPGAGYTEPPPGFTFTLREYADMLARFLRGLNIGPVHLLGNSMGGAISIVFAAEYPELVHTLTLVSPAVPDLRPSLNRMSDRRIPLAFLPFVGARFRRLLADTTPRQRAEQVVALCFANPAVVPAHRLAEAEREFAERMNLAWASRALALTTLGLLRAWMVPPSQSLWRLVPKVTMPALVVWGTEDKLVTVRKAPRTAQLLPRARLLVLPRTGHVAQIERPETVARAVLGLWEGARNDTW